MVKKREAISVQGKTRKTRSELDKLLGDEGALVMLYQADKSWNADKIVPREYINTAVTYIKRRSEGKPSSQTPTPSRAESRQEKLKTSKLSLEPPKNGTPKASAKKNMSKTSVPKKLLAKAEQKNKSHGKKVEGKKKKETADKPLPIAQVSTAEAMKSTKKTQMSSQATPKKAAVTAARQTPVKAKTPLRKVQGTPGKITKRKNQTTLKKVLKAIKPKTKASKSAKAVPSLKTSKKVPEKVKDAGKSKKAVSKKLTKLLPKSKTIKKRKIGAKKDLQKNGVPAGVDGQATRSEPADPDASFSFVFEPRPDRNPAEMSRIVRRRSWSSNSSGSDIETEEQTRAEIHSAAQLDVPEIVPDVSEFLSSEEPPFPNLKRVNKKRVTAESEDGAVSETGSHRSESSISSLKVPQASGDLPSARKKGPSILAPIVSEEEAKEFLIPPSAMSASSEPQERNATPDGSRQMTVDGVAGPGTPTTIQSSSRSEGQRSSLRQAEAHYHYREFTLRKLGHVTQIVFNPVSTKLKNSLSVPVLKEFRQALLSLRKDKNCKVVLVTSVNRIFCQGVDLSYLVHSSPERCRKAALETTDAIKYFVWTLAHFPKPIVAGVEGRCVGLGAAMLPLFDLVYASDTATFCMPYGKLGQVPEGAVSLSFPVVFGNSLTCSLLYGSRKLTASEAQQCGLVTSVLWPDQFLEELIPMVQALAGHASQGMESTKALLRQQIRSKLAATLENESTLLVQHWSSQEGQRLIKQYLNSDEVIFQ